MKTHVIIGMILILSGCFPQLKSENSAQPKNVSSAGHVIVPANCVPQAVFRAGLGLDHRTEWKMEESDVAAVENSINALFAKPDKRLRCLPMSTEGIFPLSDYYMRYAGVLKDGKKLIVGQGFCKFQSDPEEVLQSSGTLGNWGGGSYYFTVVYNATDKRLVELTYNAPL